MSTADDPEHPDSDADADLESDAAPVAGASPPGRVLVVTAHPDDVDFGAGATVAWLVATGWEVAYCVATDGDAGGYDPTVPRADIPVIRRAEQTEAARRLGVSELHWLGYPDGRLEPTLDLRRDLSRVIRTVRPDRVICQNPERSWASIYGSHPDHMAAGEAALRAVYPDARNPFAFPELAAEGLEAYSVPEVWVMGGPDPDVVLDLTEFLDRKVEALRAHESQGTDREGRLPEFMRGWMERTAAAGGLPAGRLAEAFRRMDTK